MLRTKHSMAEQLRRSRPLHNLTVTRKGKTWSFWSMAPQLSTVWLTDGTGFLLWNTKKNMPESGGVKTLDDLPTYIGGMPVCDDASLPNSMQRMAGTRL